MICFCHYPILYLKNLKLKKDFNNILFNYGNNPLNLCALTIDFAPITNATVLNEVFNFFYKNFISLKVLIIITPFSYKIVSAWEVVGLFTPSSMSLQSILSFFFVCYTF